MFNKREKEFNDLVNEAERIAQAAKAGAMLSVEQVNSFAGKLSAILYAPDLNAWIEAVRIALEALAAKLYGNGDRPKWTKIASAAVQIAAFVVTMIRSLKQLKK